MEEQLVPCCKCKKIPTIKVEVGELYYASCGCSKWNKYEILGVNRRNCIKLWNSLNTSLKRTGYKRKNVNI